MWWKDSVRQIELSSADRLLHRQQKGLLPLTNPRVESMAIWKRSRFGDVENGRVSGSSVRIRVESAAIPVLDVDQDHHPPSDLVDEDEDDDMMMMI